MTEEIIDVLQEQSGEGVTQEPELEVVEEVDEGLKVIDLEGNKIDYVEGMSVRMQDGVYYLLSDYEILENQPNVGILKKNKLEELEAVYTNAQWISLTAGYTFAVPLKGDFFNVLLTNQVLAAQVVGYASLILQDATGQMRVLQDVPFEKWKAFYTVAKDISFSNLILKNQKQVEIMSAQSEEQLSAISIEIFPPIQQIAIQI